MLEWKRQKWLLAFGSLSILGRHLCLFLSVMITRLLLSYFCIRSFQMILYFENPQLYCSTQNYCFDCFACNLHFGSTPAALVNIRRNNWTAATKSILNEFENAIYTHFVDTFNAMSFQATKPSSLCRNAIFHHGKFKINFYQNKYSQSFVYYCRAL